MRWFNPLLFITASVLLGMFMPWRPEAAASLAALDCSPPQRNRRTFVGFKDGHEWLGQFETAATEARQVLRATREQFCTLEPLPPALRGAPVEITAVMFGREDLAVADVQLQRVGIADRRWSLHVVRGADGWQVVAARRQQALR